MYNNVKNEKLTLKKLLSEKSFRFSKEPIFKLAAGGLSQFYIDCRTTTLYSKGMVLIGNVVFSLIDPFNLKGIGGLTLGADPIANSTSMIAGQKGFDLISFVVRKHPKNHGMMKWIEGGVESGDRVVIVDDVLTTGKSIIQAIEKSTENGLEIVKVMVLVDREEGGKENLFKKGYEVEAIFTKTELMEEWTIWNSLHII